jgi:hypothetical protein
MPSRDVWARARRTNQQASRTWLIVRPTSPPSGACVWEAVGVGDVGGRAGVWGRRRRLDGPHHTSPARM